MTTGDTFHIKGGMIGRPGVAMLGGATDDGIQVDSFIAARVVASETTGTYSIWFNVADTTGPYALFGAGDAGAVQYFYFAVVGGEMQVKAAMTGPNVAWDLISTDAVINPHQWHQFTFVQDGIRPQLYLDGKLLAVTETDITEATYWMDTFQLLDGAHLGCADSIGGGALLTLELAGAIGETKYWDTGLTASQVLDNYIGTGTTTNLVAKWDMIEDYVDSVGGEDGTAVGDIILTENYCEFTSKFKFQPSAPTLVGDATSFSVDGNTGYAIITLA